MNLYLIVIWYDVEATLEGPFPTVEARLARARRLREGSDEHGIYALDCEGTPTLDDFGDPL